MKNTLLSLSHMYCAPYYPTGINLAWVGAVGTSVQSLKSGTFYR